MAVDRGTGFFDFTFMGQIEKTANLMVAKGMAIDRVNATEGARPENVRKAMAMIMGANSIRQLVLGMGNFALSHLDPKLKVIR